MHVNREIYTCSTTTQYDDDDGDDDGSCSVSVVGIYSVNCQAEANRE